MAGINLINQLKGEDAGASTYEAPIVDSGGGRGLSMPKFSLSTGEFDKADLLRLVIIGIGIGIIWGTKYYVAHFTAHKTTEKQAEVQKIQGQIDAVQKRLAQLKDLQAEEDAFNKRVVDLQKKLELVESVSKGRNLAVRMVDFIVNEMPSSLWLTKITVDLSAEAKVDIAGSASSMQLVSEFVKRLEGAVFFPSWQLVETERDAPIASADPKTRGHTIDSKKFSIGAKVVKP